MGKRQNSAGPSFLIKIYGKQNATWQGQITFLEEKKTCAFRSALELLNLMDEVIEEEMGDADLSEFREEVDNTD